MLGIGGLIYAAIMFASNSGAHNVKILITFAVLGLLFFGTGISLVRTTKDERE